MLNGQEAYKQTRLIRPFAIHIENLRVLSHSVNTKWRLWSDMADVQNNFSLSLVHK